MINDQRIRDRKTTKEKERKRNAAKDLENVAKDRKRK